MKRTILNILLAGLIAIMTAAGTVGLFQLSPLTAQDATETTPEEIAIPTLTVGECTITAAFVSKELEVGDTSSFILTVHNPTEEPAELDLACSLEVTPAGGMMMRFSPPSVSQWTEDQHISLEPGESVDITCAPDYAMQAGDQAHIVLTSGEQTVYTDSLSMPGGPYEELLLKQPEVLLLKQPEVPVIEEGSELTLGVEFVEEVATDGADEDAEATPENPLPGNGEALPEEDAPAVEETPAEEPQE